MLLTITMSFSLDSFLVIVQFIVCDWIEWILSVWCFVDGRIMLVSTLNDALGGGAHQHHMIVSTGRGGVLDTIGLVPSHALQYVRLWSSRDFVSTSVFLNLYIFVFFFQNIEEMNIQFRMHWKTCVLYFIVACRLHVQNSS